MKSEFDDLRLNDQHSYQADSNGDKQIVKIFKDEQMIAKKVKIKKSIRYFGADGYEQYLSEQHS